MATSVTCYPTVFSMLAESMASDLPTVYFVVLFGAQCLLGVLCILSMMTSACWFQLEPATSYSALNNESDGDNETNAADTHVRVSSQEPAVLPRRSRVWRKGRWYDRSESPVQARSSNTDHGPSDEMYGSKEWLVDSPQNSLLHPPPPPPFTSSSSATSNQDSEIVDVERPHTPWWNRLLGKPS
jgi:hypothetical protein